MKNLTGLIVFVIIIIVAMVVVFDKEPGTAGGAGPETDPDIDVSISYYDIDGNTEQELRQDLNSKGVRWTDGKSSRRAHKMVH